MLGNTVTVFGPEVQTVVTNCYSSKLGGIWSRSIQKTRLSYRFLQGGSQGNSDPLKPRGFPESVGKAREGGGGGTCQDLRCPLRTPVSTGASAFPLPTCPPAVMTSRRRLPGSQRPERAPIGGAGPAPRVTSGGAAAILSVASGSRALPKCSSPWLPGGRFFPLRVAGGRAPSERERERAPTTGVAFAPPWVAAAAPLPSRGAVCLSPEH